MFPLSDVIPSRTRPGVTMSLIALNALVFLYQIQLDDRALQELVDRYGVVATRLTAPALLVSLFLHSDLLHAGMNMVFLWIFGDNVEDRLGHGRFLLFYLGTGVIAALAQVAADPASPVPMIGASGAIAGIMGVYFLLYPQSRILTAVFLVVFMDVIEIPALFFLGLWFLLQVVHAALTDVPGDIAFWAHAAGFVTGALVGLWLRVRDRRWSEYWRDVR